VGVASPTALAAMAPFRRGNSLYTIVDGPSWTQAEAFACSKLLHEGKCLTINSRI